MELRFESDNNNSKNCRKGIKRVKTIKKQNNKENKFNMQLFKILIVFLIVATCIIMVKPVQAATLTPNGSQYIEMRAKDINDVNNEKQLVFELWAHDIDFKGFDVRFKYDDTKVEPSNINTNEIVDVDIDDSSTYFKFENEFENAFDCLAMIDPNATNTNVIRMIFSINTPAEDSEHIINDTFISSSQDVLIGKMSFKMKEEPFDITGFSLVTDADSSPTTGIKINTNVTDNYQAQSTFQFTDKTASKDATLKKLQISREIEDETDPGTMIDKDYPLDPVFDTATKTYKLEILEYIDTMDLLAERNDEKATMKLKYPKRNIEKDIITGEITKDELVYGTPGDETTLQYDEVNLTDNTKQKIVLNKLGEPDTVLTVEVTAEDGTTIENYEITIHRPYGTIKGSIQLGNDVRSSLDTSYGVYVEYIGNVKIYKNGEFDWDSIINQDLTYDDLDLIEPQINFEIKDVDTGAYEIYVIPGKYDIELVSPGFLDTIYTNINIQEGDEKDFGNEILTPGDVNHDGVISVKDVQLIQAMMDATIGDGIYEEEKDIGNKGFIGVGDLVYIQKNMDELMNIK